MFTLNAIPTVNSKLQQTNSLIGQTMNDVNSMRCRYFIYEKFVATTTRSQVLATTTLYSISPSYLPTTIGLPLARIFLPLSFSFFFYLLPLSLHCLPAVYIRCFFFLL